MKKQELVVETSLGDVQATKAGQGEPWHIQHPWGDERFYGSKTEARKRIGKIVDKNDDDR